MSEPKEKSGSPQMWFLPLLGLVFITLKLTGFIDWSWWWVLAPLWAPNAVSALILIWAGILSSRAEK